MNQQEPPRGQGQAPAVESGRGLSRRLSVPDAPGRARRLLGWLRMLRGPMAMEAQLRGVACPADGGAWGSPIEWMPAGSRPLGVMQPDPVRAGRRARRLSLKRRTTDLLLGLGASSDLVADSLRRAGVRGTPGSAEWAPVAVYLAAVVGAEPGVSGVTVTAGEARIDREARWRRAVTVRFPGPVAAFAHAFDAGFYPVLRG